MPLAFSISNEVLVTDDSFRAGRMIDEFDKLRCEPCVLCGLLERNVVGEVVVGIADNVDTSH